MKNIEYKYTKTAAFKTAYNFDSPMGNLYLTSPLKQTMVQAPSLLSGSVSYGSAIHKLSAILPAEATKEAARKTAGHRGRQNKGK